MCSSATLAASVILESASSRSPTEPILILCIQRNNTVILSFERCKGCVLKENNQNVNDIFDAIFGTRIYILNKWPTVGRRGKVLGWISNV